MKVKDILRKINYASSKLPVYLQCGISGEPRKVISLDFNGYPFEEQDRTVASVSLGNDCMTIYYK